MQKTKYSRKNNFSLGKQNGWSQKLVDPDVRKIFWDKCFVLKKILNNFILHIMNNFMTVMCKICFSSTHQILFHKLPIKYECFMMIYFLFVLFSFLLVISSIIDMLQRHFFSFYFLLSACYPANILLFKVSKRKLEKSLKFVQS